MVRYGTGTALVKVVRSTADFVRIAVQSMLHTPSFLGHNRVYPGNRLGSRWPVSTSSEVINTGGSHSAAKMASYRDAPGMWGP